MNHVRHPEGNNIRWQGLRAISDKLARLDQAAAAAAAAGANGVPRRSRASQLSMPSGLESSGGRAPKLDALAAFALEGTDLVTHSLRHLEVPPL